MKKVIETINHKVELMVKKLSLPDTLLVGLKAVDNQGRVLGNKVFRVNTFVSEEMYLEYSIFFSKLFFTYLDYIELRKEK